jgi:hypothetical protein
MRRYQTVVLKNNVLQLISYKLIIGLQENIIVITRTSFEHRQTQ